MSAYIVENKTINKVVCWIEREVWKHNFTLDQIAQKYQVDLYGDMWKEKLAKAMFQLNCAGVDARYGEGRAKKDVSAPFVYKSEQCDSLVEVFKALQCFTYQCCEGDVPETNLYKFFGEVENHLAQKIVMALPEYDK